MSESQNFISAAYKGDLLELYSILKKTGLDPCNLKDSRGFTGLHIACFNGNYTMLEFLIDYVIRNFAIEASKLIKLWANLPNDEGFLPLHYAAFKGQMAISI